VTVQNGSGVTVGQTNYNYDQTAVATTTGTPQHVSVTGSRGNLTSVNYYTHGSTYLTQSTTYFDTGNPQMVTDANGSQTNYTYGACGNSFPTNVSEPLSLSHSVSWNCTGGVQTFATDENGKAASTSYTLDHDFWRPESTTDPTNAVTNFTYTGQTQIESVLNIVTGSSAADTLVTIDNQGRPQLTQARQTPGVNNFDTAETDYDVAGRSSRATIPFPAAAGQTSSSAPSTTATFDALNRALQITDGGGGTATYTYLQNDVYVSVAPPSGENAKRRQLEYDALGRLTSVCEVTSGVGSGTCGQSTSRAGYWTKYSYNALGQLTGVTQNAQSGSSQSRTFAYDLMGRLTSEAHAESGTTSYVYDTDATCGTFAGDLVKRVDAVGNTTCYGHDALHRLTNKTYAGPYAPNTLNKYYVYDTATVNGVAMVNGKARLVEAYTSTTSTGTKTTDAGLSYSARGEVSDIYQSSPSSGGYYHSIQQYWPNGAIHQVSGLPTLPIFTYGVDGEGRITTLSASTGQNPLTQTTYNSASLPTGLTFGSGDSDAYSFDSTTNRMTKYQFNVNGQSFVGILTWNSNNTLATQSITDPFNSTDTQNCSYSHDDLVRISSANCGSAWSQTFAYDAFGNLTKSGSMSFQPTYSSTTNRMTSLPGFTPTYDANGNVLSDGSHTYTWDVEGLHATVDGIGVTYDALGRMVENALPSEYVYLPDGSVVLFKGQVAHRGWFKLPGGAKAVYDSTAGGLIDYYHADHLGSSRLATTPTRTFDYSMAYAPFGEPYAESAQRAGFFTGEIENFGLDIYEFPAREYNIQGRWASPDPAGLAAVDPTNPQSWNRYAYVMNNPLSYVDPLGLDLCVLPNGSAVDGSGMTKATCEGSSSTGGMEGTWVPSGDSVTVTGTAADMPPAISVFGVGQPTWTGGGRQNFANNGSNCTVSPATAKQYLAATGQVVAMTAEFFSGLGPGNPTFAPNSATSQVMAQSAGVQSVLSTYSQTGQTSGLYTFGLSGLVSAGGNPVAQFVGSFRWSITPVNGGINLSLTNTTSFKSLTYDSGPQWQRGSFPTPMGNTHQTYNITAGCH
jgi:RHS repeat-associated protein